MVRTETCTSCGIRLVGRGNAAFSCPSCGEGMIGRCRQCRNQSATYVCPSCSFKGP